MSEFGQQLRKFRHRCNDSKSPHGKLTQEDFGELVGVELGIASYTGAAVSDWELGKTRIQADDRRLLIAMIKVLHTHGGITAVKEANQLLHAGNFRDLNPGEIESIFNNTLRELNIDQPGSEETTSKLLSAFLLGNLFSISADELQRMIAKAEEGPSPSWPRLLAALMRNTSERISVSPKTVLWIGIWWLAWWLMAPSLRWPFENGAAALQAVCMYVVGTLVIPLLVGSLIDTKHNDYWKERGLGNSLLLRLFTHQGAGIGFNLGYFIVLPLVLVRHYLDLGPSNWPVVIAVTLGLILANMGARVVPHNLLLVYNRLRFGDGAIFFVVALIGPLWGLFFLEYYSILLTPFWGTVVILAALLLLIMIPVGQSRKKTD